MFQASLIERVCLTKPGAVKETWHLVLDIPDPHFSYEPGDSLGVYAENDLDDVHAIVQFFNLPHSHVVKDLKTQKEIESKSYFLKHVDLTKVPLKLVKAIEKHLTSSQLVALQKAWETHGERGSLFVPALTFLENFWDASLPFDLFLSNLHPLHPRFYSIASSPKKHSKRADLVVAKVTHNSLGVVRKGLCSNYLTERAPLHEPHLRVMVEKASHFRLPKDEKAPVLMIGPGTGVAPFKAFLEEMEHSRTIFPPCWLFFGSRNRSCDFLYEEYFLKLQERQKLILDLAFSRDHEEKKYVQHKMWDQRVKLASWLESQGAYVYICGSAKSMAKDVEEMLIRILLDQNICHSREDAFQYLANMRKSGRYCKDVY